MTVTCSDVCKIFWAIFFPPIAVAMEKGCCTCAVLLNCLLTLLGWIPGQIHAFCVILHCTDDDDRHQQHQPVQSAPTQPSNPPMGGQPAPAQPATQPAAAPQAAATPAPATTTAAPAQAAPETVIVLAPPPAPANP